MALPHLPSATAVMPARNDAAHIGAAIESVLTQLVTTPLALVVAVGPSDDGTDRVVAQIAAENPDVVRVVTNPSGQTAAALNAAIAAAAGDVLVRVDAHCVLPPGYVEQAIATMRRTSAANVGGRQHAVGTSGFQRAVAAAMTSRFGVGDSKFHFGGDEGPTDTVYLGVFDAEALRSVGGFDETLVRNQDYELNVRLREAGHTVWFDPNLVVQYTPRDGVGRLARQYFEYGRWKREVIRRHPSSTKMRQLVAPATVAGIAIGSLLAATGHRWGLAAPAIYGAAVVAAALATKVRPEDRSHLLSVYPTMHLSWGVGFLIGPPRGAQESGRSAPRDTNQAAPTARLAPS